MTVYLDASVLIALLLTDPHAAGAEALVQTAAGRRLALSDLAAAEFGSVVARRVRERLLTVDEADAACDLLDRWAATEAQPVETWSIDIRRASNFLRRRDLNLRTQDAIHIAVAERLGAALATFDAGMSRAAVALGVPLAEG